MLPDGPPPPPDDPASRFHVAVFARLRGGSAASPPPEKRRPRRREASRRWRALARRRAREAARALRVWRGRVDDLRRSILTGTMRGGRALAEASRSARRAGRVGLERGRSWSVVTVGAMRRSVRGGSDGIRGTLAGWAGRARSGLDSARARARSGLAHSWTSLAGAARAARAAGRGTSVRLATSARAAAAKRAAARRRITEAAAMARASLAHAARAGRTTLGRRAARARRGAARAAHAGAAAGGRARSAAASALGRAAERIPRGFRTAAAGAGRGLGLLRPLLLPAGAALLGALMVFAVALARSFVMGMPQPRFPVRAAATTPADPSAKLHADAAVLGDPGQPEERLVAVVEQVARDGRDTATDLLLSAADGPSVVVAMASIRALRGRPCARVARPLVQGLAHGDWQRRAWAAKILGENGCAGVAPALRQQLARERDTRVRRQLDGALAVLDAHAAG
jgi:HEAT repeats